MFSNIGIDIVKITRISDMLNEGIIMSLFDDEEILYCTSKNNPTESFAGTFAAKEAVVKCLNCKVKFLDIVISRTKDGMPFAKIKGKSMNNIRISISHESEYAVAIALL